MQETVRMNEALVFLSQALLGSITPNFRMVTLSCEDDSWKITITLEMDDRDDKEEILDIQAEFDAQFDHGIRSMVDIIISNDEIKWPEPSSRVVYFRKE